jgi:Zn-dependent protease with chaperone function
VVEAAYFDGKTSRRHVVRLRATPGALEVAGEGLWRAEPGAGIEVSEPIGAAPRTLRFGDGAFCEVGQGPELDRLLAVLGHRDGAVARWQARWRVALVSLAAVAVVLAAGYRWGLPWAAEALAPRMPPAVVTALSDNVLQMLDKRALSPSELPKERQQQIEQEFSGLVAGDPEIRSGRLLFRHGGLVGANAFALPDGRIVLLDELADLAPTEEGILAVLAHELGHAKYRHGVRQLLQSSVVAAIVAGYLGDVSTVAAGYGTLLLQSGYSRAFELEADGYGAGLLKATGHSPAALADMLEKLEQAHARKEGHPDKPASGGAWLSSHPETAERIARLKAMAQ